MNCGASKHKHVIITVNFMKTFVDEIKKSLNEIPGMAGGFKSIRSINLINLIQLIKFTSFKLHLR